MYFNWTFDGNNVINTDKLNSAIANQRQSGSFTIPNITVGINAFSAFLNGVTGNHFICNIYTQHVSLSSRYYKINNACIIGGYLYASIEILSGFNLSTENSWTVVFYD